MTDELPLSGEEILKLARWYIPRQYRKNEDLLQFAALRLVTKLKRFDPKVGINPYKFAHQHMQYTIHDYFKTEKPYYVKDKQGQEHKIHRYVFDSTRDYTSEDIETNNDAFILRNYDKLSTEDRLELRYVIDLLKQEPQRTREIIFRYVFLEEYASEIATRFNVSESLIWRIIHKFRNRYLLDESWKFSRVQQTDLPAKRQQSNSSLESRQSRPIESISFRKLGRAA